MNFTIKKKIWTQILALPLINFRNWGKFLIRKLHSSGSCEKGMRCLHRDYQRVWNVVSVQLIAATVAFTAKNRGKVLVLAEITL